jgi:hypothetical protein
MPPPLSVRRLRLTYAFIAIATVAVGLFVHTQATGVNRDVRDVLGDALWAMMMVWLVSALAPQTGIVARAVVSLAICYAVEFSQLYQASWVDSLRETTVGQLVLGSGFDPRDLAAYAAGVLVAAMLDRLRARPGPTHLGNGSS